TNAYEMHREVEGWLQRFFDALFMAIIVARIHPIGESFDRRACGFKCGWIGAKKGLYSRPERFLNVAGRQPWSIVHQLENKFDCGEDASNSLFSICVGGRKRSHS